MLLDKCEESEYFLLPFCYSECPKHFYPSQSGTSTGTGNSDVVRGGVCLRCHLTCLHCTGPANTDCLNCTAHRRLTDDRRCTNVDAESHHLSLLVIVAIAMLPVFVIGVSAVAVWLWRQRRNDTKRSDSQLMLTCINSGAGLHLPSPLNVFFSIKRQNSHKKNFCQVYHTIFLP